MFDAYTVDCIIGPLTSGLRIVISRTFLPISPVDSDIIIVSSAGCPGFNERQPILNPGAYLSKDSGRHWTKVNKNLGQPDKIVDIKPDIHDRNVFWCALWGSGWYKGVLTE